VRALALRAAGAAVCLAAAVILLLVALDARAWSSRFPADDLRYRRMPTAHGLWQPRELSPFHVDRSILGIGDDISYRKALREFRLGRPLEAIFEPQVTTHRVFAEIALTNVIRSTTDHARASQAANLLGVLGFAMATQDVGQRATFLNNAITAFRAAIALDQSNDDALFNLEYALDQLKGGGEQQAGGSDKLGRGGRAGFKPTGHGY